MLSPKKSHTSWDDDPTLYSEVKPPAAKLHDSHVNDCNQCHKWCWCQGGQVFPWKKRFVEPPSLATVCRPGLRPFWKLIVRHNKYSKQCKVQKPRDQPVALAHYPYQTVPAAEMPINQPMNDDWWQESSFFLGPLIVWLPRRNMHSGNSGKIASMAMQ